MTFSIRHLHKKETRHAKVLRIAKGALRRLPWQRVLRLGIILARPMYDLGKGLKERHEKQHHMKHAMAVGAGIITALVIALLAFSLLLKIGSLSMGSLLKVTGTPVAATDEGITNILLLGEGDDTGQSLLDTIIIASIDPVKTNSIALLSLPRDLYFLHTDQALVTEKGKLNALWRDAAIALHRQGMDADEASITALTQLKDEIGFALSVPIHHVIKVDFSAFEQAIDAFGGIEVTVPETIHDTEFPGPNYTYQTFHIDAGHHVMDGVTALKYARTRSTTSDFDRSARQQQLVGAALKKAQEGGILKNPSTVMELYGILAEHIETDLKTRQLVTLASIGKKTNPDHFYALQVNNVNGLYGDQLFKGGLLYSPPRDLFNGESVLLPVSIPEFPVTWKQLRVLTKLFFVERYPYLDRPRVAVLNGGSKEGTARNLYRELTRFGFDVIQVRNIPGKRDIEASFITSQDDEAATAFFATLLSLPRKQLPEDRVKIHCGDDAKCIDEEFGTVTIVLGKDFAFQRFQDTVKTE
jgi:LCP family protein required for cell wall assembly